MGWLVWIEDPTNCMAFSDRSAIRLYNGDQSANHVSTPLSLGSGGLAVDVTTADATKRWGAGLLIF